MTAPEINADAGLFGPESVTWRLHGEPVLWIAGLRTLMLQALHPLAMAGVAQHSAYRSDPWGRLMRTVRWVGVTTYGTTAQAEAAGARVRMVHRAVRGIDPETGLAYSADDPALLRWIHACEVESFLSTLQRAGVRISADEADRYVAEQTALGPLVGLAASELPATSAELGAYFDGVRPELRATADARAATRFLFTMPMPRWVALATPARPAWASLGALAFALLPRWARRLYGLPGLPTTDVAATAGVRLIRTALLAAPQQLTEGPHLRAARDRLARLAIAR